MRIKLLTIDLLLCMYVCVCGLYGEKKNSPRNGKDCHLSAQVCTVQLNA